MKTLQDYFDEFRYILPRDKLVTEFTKDQIFEFVDNLNETHKQQIKEWQWMEYPTHEFDTRVKLIDKISAFQDLKRNYDKYYQESIDAAECSAALKGMLGRIEELNELVKETK